MRSRRWLLALLTAALAGCGGRSSLRVGAAGATPTGPGGTGGQAGHEPQAGSGGESPTAPCVLQQVGRPAAAGFGGASTVSPSLALVDPGEGASSRRARLAVQAVIPDAGSHSDNQLVLHEIGRDWPGGLFTVEPAVTLSESSHGYGLTARSIGSVPRVALSYPGDPDGAMGLRLRAIDVASWQVEPGAEIVSGGSSLGDFVAGASVTGASYKGSGYAVGYWQGEADPSSTRAYALVVDETGAVVLGPLVLTGVVPGELGPTWGHGPSMLWTGSTYLVAVVEPQLGDLGTPVAMIRVGTLAPDGGSGAFVLADSFEALGVLGGESWAVGRPSIAKVGEEIWLAWPEGFELAPEVVRLVRLASDGTVLAQPVSLSIPLLDSLRPVLAAGQGVGPTLSWVSEGDVSLPDGAFGRSFLITQPLGDDGTPTAERVEAPIFGPALDYAQVTATRYPHGLVATFSSTEETFVHRLDCGDTLPTSPDGCLACPAVLPAEGTACPSSPPILCAFPSKTPHAGNLARCEAGSWRYYGTGTEPPVPGECPLEQPTGLCDVDLACLYGTQGSWDYTRCTCAGMTAWQCTSQTICE